MARPQSEAMKAALAAITDKRKTVRLAPPEAAKKFGVALNSIYRTPGYKEWRGKQKKASAA